MERRRRLILFLVASTLLAARSSLPAVLALHPDSLSSTRIEVTVTGILLTQRVQVLSLSEVIPDLDADADGRITAVEIERSRAPIFDYLSSHYRLFGGTDREFEGGELLTLTPVMLTLVDGLMEERRRGFSAGAVDAVFRHEAGEPVTDLMVETDMFLDTSPGHIDLLTIEWVGWGSESFGMDGRGPRARSDPTGRGAFAAFFALGWHHILSGWDHLAFVLALVLAARSLHVLLSVVTAFTVAHSVTLALAALDVVDARAWGSAVETFIALSIAYVGADTALHPFSGRSRWLEAFAFGLLHGLGFAGFLRSSLVREPSQGVALLSFNVGVEAGQVAVVLVAVALLVVVRRATMRRLQRGDDAEKASVDFLAPLALRRFGSAAIALLGLFWFFERI